MNKIVSVTNLEKHTYTTLTLFEERDTAPSCYIIPLMENIYISFVSQFSVGVFRSQGSSLWLLCSPGVLLREGRGRHMFLFQSQKRCCCFEL